ncbi:carboxypeptidase-like regulatory domain-containing protein [Algivirga pacifica]|uniref:CarboxypepD_reg-like domain-containing protein n=1 Tax=Algivirga pacifica TaxID=1162670 RepID=A0ABP9D9D8_9BACT
MNYRLLLSTYLLLHVFTLAYTQERIIEGTLLDSQGDPMIGANITEVGTTNGTVANFDGYYKLKVPLGATIRVVMIGYRSRIFTVTEENSRSVNALEQQKPIVINPDYKPSVPQKIMISDSLMDVKEGIGLMEHNATTYELASDLWGKPFDQYTLREYEWKYRRGRYYQEKRMEVSVPRLSYMGIFQLGLVGKLPKLQQEYAQGRPVDGNLTWRGGHDNEQFSWGPKVKELVYDNSNYTYDPKGQLQLGTFGIPAETYNPYEIFKPSIGQVHRIGIEGIYWNQRYHARYSRKDARGIWEGNKEEQNTFSVGVGKERDAWRYNIDYRFAQEESLLPNVGGLYQRILFNAITTPPTFDHSYNPSLTYADNWSINPYQLLRTDTKKQVRNHWLGGKVAYHDNWWNVSLAGAYWTEYIGQKFEEIGNTPTTSTDRVRKFEQGNLTTQWEHTIDGMWNSEFKYMLNWITRDYLTQHNREDYSEEIRPLLKSRITHQWLWRGKVGHTDYHATYLKLGNNIYHSNTLQEQKVLWWSPSITWFTYPLEILTNLTDVWIDNERSLRTRIAYARSYQEVSLKDYPQYMNAMSLSSSDLNNYYPYQESIISNGIAPEQVDDISVALSYTNGINNHYFFLNADWFYRKYSNVLLPVQSDMTTYSWTNTGTYRNRGINIELNYQLNLGWGENSWESTLIFERVRNKVLEVYSPSGRVQIAGFDNIGKYMIEGQPLGVLVGSEYERDGFGNHIIDDTGYPKVKRQRGIIGDPNPDWMLKYNTTFSYEGWRIEMLWDIKKGGQVWNGTRQMLNYLGRSEETGELREEVGYIYRGVTEQGEINTQAVDFAAPALGIEHNRWVRYGAEGVAEEVVEDGSWLRLQSLSVGYGQQLDGSDFFYRWGISLQAENLILWTPYTGIDPQTTLLSHHYGIGMDYFNVPTMRTFKLKLSLTL